MIEVYNHVTIPKVRYGLEKKHKTKEELAFLNGLCLYVLKTGWMHYKVSDLFISTYCQKSTFDSHVVEKQSLVPGRGL